MTRRNKMPETKTSARLLMSVALLSSAAIIMPAWQVTQRPVLHRIKAETISPARTNAVQVLSNLPLGFEPNQGQAEPEVKFLSRGFGYSMALTSTEVRLRLPESPNHESRSPEDS